MTDQPSAADTNDTFPDLPDVAEQIRALTPSLAVILADRFSVEARGAQNFAMLLAALGIALQAGLITLEKVTVNDAEVAFASATTAVALLTIASAFFLVRFVFLAWRDSCAYRLKMFAAAASMNDVAESIHRQVLVLHRRAEENEDDAQEGRNTYKPSVAS